MGLRCAVPRLQGLGLRLHAQLAVLIEDQEAMWDKPTGTMQENPNVHGPEPSQLTLGVLPSLRPASQNLQDRVDERLNPVGLLKDSHHTRYPVGRFVTCKPGRQHHRHLG